MRLLLMLFLVITSISFAQNYKIIKSETSNKAMLVGVSPREAFQDTNFAYWFNSEYIDYNLDSNTIISIIDKFEGKLIKIVLGTWCGDSRREVPHFVKLLDFINFPNDKVSYINVDRDKKSLNGEEEGLNVELVPTFIIYEEGKEIGRIIESPLETLEKDIYKILANQP